ncbi:hypothetical protein U6N30_05300 [Blastococcus brunescens]|uniref:Uncharacterized protein n=1 Tax=Blastococcus brunescens TaxID=1564165 RepID=A0ABZ1B2S3_9ACTN|nr:hypothetical protein [Blastococcus sp. BMG 8361]WRL65105.1 hypothetical protein U6N30_05300 [Blastococcus sp. BMG 8361]
MVDALRSADGGEVMRRLLLTMPQALFDAEAPCRSARSRTSAPRAARRSATAPAKTLGENSGAVGEGEMQHPSHAWAALTPPSAW